MLEPRQSPAKVSGFQPHADFLSAGRNAHHAAVEVQAQADEVDFGDVRSLNSDETS